jgi:hypothetical protein
LINDITFVPDWITMDIILFFLGNTAIAILIQSGSEVLFYNHSIYTTNIINYQLSIIH